MIQNNTTTTTDANTDTTNTQATNPEGDGDTLESVSSSSAAADPKEEKHGHTATAAGERNMNRNILKQWMYREMGIMPSRRMDMRSGRNGCVVGLVSGRIPQYLKEAKTLTDVCQNTDIKFDKIFASCWLDEDCICFGTKDNKLFTWNVQSNALNLVPLPSKNRSTTPLDSCGVHFITKNLNSTLIATGARNPCDIAILDMASMTCPTLILEGHNDWCFSAEFISQSHLVSGGRDGNVKVWNVLPDSDPTIRQPMLTRQEHQRKVRDLKFNSNTQVFATVSADNYVKHWDISNFDVISSVCLEGNELVCMAIDPRENLTAVGTQTYCALIDHRSSSVVQRIPSADEWGIRSIAFNDRIISFGGGRGNLHFFDLRTGSNPLLDKKHPFLKSGTGWILQDSTFLDHFQGVDAIYTHNWSPSKSSLFIGGGPLLLGLKGSYAGLWL